MEKLTDEFAKHLLLGNAIHGPHLSPTTRTSLLKEQAERLKKKREAEKELDEMIADK